MKTIKTATFLLAIFAASIFFSFIIPQDKTPKPWTVPAKYEKMKNPYASDKSLTSVGKSLFAKHCKSCHGSDGLGDGNKAAQLKTYPGDFTSDEFKAQSDGALYYKSFIGRDEMPNFEKKISDEEDQWAVINYIKTFE